MVRIFLTKRTRALNACAHACARLGTHRNSFFYREMVELVEQMKLMNVLMNLQIKEVNERMERLECHLRRIDFSNEFIARAHGYRGLIHQDSNNSPRKIIRGGFE